MRPIVKGMAFYPENAYEKFWIYKRENTWYFVFPLRYPNINFSGFRIAGGTRQEVLEEGHYTLALLEHGEIG